MRALPVPALARTLLAPLALGFALTGCPDDSTAPEEIYRLYWFFQNTSDADVTFEVEDEGGASSRTVVVSPGQPTVVETEDFYRTPTTSIRVIVRAGTSTTADTRKVISVRKGFSEEIRSSWNGCDLTVRTEPGDAIENLVAATCLVAAEVQVVLRNQQNGYGPFNPQTQTFGDTTVHMLVDRNGEQFPCCLVAKQGERTTTTTVTTADTVRITVVIPYINNNVTVIGRCRLLRNTPGSILRATLDMSFRNPTNQSFVHCSGDGANL